MEKRIACFLIVSMSFCCLNLYAQKTKLSLDLQNVTIKDVFREIEKNSEYIFLFQDQGIESKKVSINIKDKTLEEVLKELFSNTNITYKIADRQVLITTKEKAGALQTPKITIKGVVSDAQSEPLIGASVLLKTEAGIGTITDLNGSYELDVPDKNAIIQFKYLGYISKEEKVGDRLTINVKMQEDAGQLEEVVVVGYGVQNKKTLTGSISVVSMGDVETSSKSTVSQALAGKAAGLRVNQISAQAGGGSSFKIRGETSVGAGNEPLIVIDGFPVNANASLGSGNIYEAGTTDNYLESINPDDIESISVLKDAASTAIYGARAGHGVILITTKRGAQDRSQINYSGSISVQTIAKNYEMLNPKQYMDMRNRQSYEEYLRTNALGIYADYVTPPTGDTPAYTPFYTYDQIKNIQGTDWVNEIMRTGALHQHNLSLSGGTETSRYLVSGNYMSQDGVIKNNAAQRFTLRANLDKDINKYFSVGMTASYSRNHYDNVPLGNGENETSGIITAAAQFNPTLPIRDINGNYTIDPSRSTTPNPVSLLEISDETTKDRILGTAYLIFKPVAGLDIKAQLGADRQFQDRSSYLPKTVLEGSYRNGEANIRKENSLNYLAELTATYTKTFAEHRIKTLIGYATEQMNLRRENLKATDFLLDGFSYNSMGYGSERPEVGSYASKSALRSYFGRINYDYANRYLLEATLRADGASNFAPDRQWGYFPSVALGWIISEESFMEPAKDWLSNLKIRGSYGETGNYNVGYHIEDFFGIQNPAAIIGDKIAVGVMATDLGNKLLTWETTSEMNIGLDLGFFNNRLSITAEYYNRQIRDLLSWQNLREIFEVDNIVANIGITKSQGFELTVNTVNFTNKNFSWNTTVTLSHYEDQWKERSPYWWDNHSPYISFNDPIRSMYTYESLGILQPGQPRPKAQPNLLPGMVIIKDQNGDNTLTEEDMIFKGNQDPDLIFGFNNTLHYKQFDFNIYFYGETGRSKYNSYMENWVDMYSGRNVTAYAYETISSTNPVTTRPSVLNGSSGYGDFYVKDIYFIRCGNIKIGYNIPLRNIVKNIHIFADVSNPFIITNWTGLDPETDNLNFSYPNVRAYTAGLSVTF
ncbi:MAG: TonB-dependent receptor [Tannerella sp.]|jgi:TonB-linked SusC/RagA family outer membrane protein|nr:TonB-dependent receptor [Tannerella sp.]